MQKEELVGFHRIMIQLMEQAVSDTVDYINDVVLDCGDDLEEIAKATDIRNLVNVSHQMMVNLLDPEIDMSTESLPESVKAALKRLILTKVELKFNPAGN